MSFENQVALVTGGSRGIGRAIAIGLAEDGADVLFTYFRNKTGADTTREHIEGLGRRAIAVPFKLGAPEGTKELFDGLAEFEGPLRVVVHNAVSATLRPVLELAERHWDHILEANLTSFFHLARGAATAMPEGGVIIAVSSLGPTMHIPGYGALAVAKAGLEALCRYLAVELAPRGINVNVVCPGVVDTAALGAFSAVVADVEAFKEEMASRAPTGRLVEPVAIANTVRFLCSPGAAAIRGQRIVIDEGLTLNKR